MTDTLNTKLDAIFATIRQVLAERENVTQGEWTTDGNFINCEWVDLYKNDRLFIVRIVNLSTPLLQGMVLAIEGLRVLHQDMQVRGNQVSRETLQSIADLFPDSPL